MTRAPLALKIAWRYLKAPKSHGAVNAISIISVVGVAIATAAIVIVLSVFNGFRHHLNARLDSLTPDIAVSPSYGKVIADGDSLAEVLANFDGVAEAMAEMTDNALIIAGTKEMPVTLKGVDTEVFSRITSLDSLLLDKVNPEVTRAFPAEWDSPMSAASISVGVAQRLGIFTPGEDLLLFAPKRHGRVNMANPGASFLSDSLEVVSVFRSLQTEFDENTVICDIETARNLFQYTTEASGILIKTQPGRDPGEVAHKIETFLGPDFVVKDRLEQQDVNFRMVAIEKWITFILLTFILVIASFNIISTLCMLILDKGNSLHTLSHIGLSKRRLGNIFWWESLFVTFLGAASGLILGLVVSLLQEKFSIIKLAGDPDSLVMLAYPVKVEGMDLLITMIPITAIGLITAWISDTFARSRLKNIS